MRSLNKVRTSGFHKFLSDRSTCDILKGMATLALGAGTARIVSLATIPILTRIYAPNDFGVLSVFTSFVLIIVPLLTLRYIFAIPLPKTDSIAINLLALTCVLAVAMTFLTAAILWAVGPTLLSLFSMEVLVPWLWLVILGGFGVGSFEVLTMWATRQKDFRAIAGSQVLQSVLGEGLKIGLGLLGVKPLGLMIGQVAGHAGGAGRLISRFTGDFSRLAHHIRLSRMFILALYHREFPLYRLPAQFLLVFSMHAPVLFTAGIYDAETTGYLGLAMMALLLPMNLVGYTMGKAYYAEISSIGKEHCDKIERVTNRTCALMFAVGLPISFVIYFFGAPIFAKVFGPNWMVAGSFASILSPYLAFQFLASPITQVFNVIGSQRSYISIYARQAILTSFPFIIGVTFKTTYVTVLTTLSATLALHYLLIFVQAKMLLRQEQVPQIT